MTDLTRIVDVTVRITVAGEAEADAVLQTLQFGVERAVNNHAGEWGFCETEIDAGDFCDPVEWEVLPATFYDHGGDPVLAKLKQEALGALRIVETTNDLDIESGFNGSFKDVHTAALDTVALTQVRLARHLGWLDADDQPKPDAPELSGTLWDGDASVAQVSAL